MESINSLDESQPKKTTETQNQLNDALVDLYEFYRSQPIISLARYHQQLLEKRLDMMNNKWWVNEDGQLAMEELHMIEQVISMKFPDQSENFALFV